MKAGNLHHQSDEKRRYHHHQDDDGWVIRHKDDEAPFYHKDDGATFVIRMMKLFSVGRMMITLRRIDDEPHALVVRNMVMILSSQEL